MIRGHLNLHTNSTTLTDVTGIFAGHQEKNALEPVIGMAGDQ
jgi:hypothetical protein